jgi:hypothetical protein
MTKSLGTKNNKFITKKKIMHHKKLSKLNEDLHLFELLKKTYEMPTKPSLSVKSLLYVSYPISGSLDSFGAGWHGMVGRPASGQTPHQQVNFHILYAVYVWFSGFCLRFGFQYSFLTAVFQCKRSLTVEPTQSNHGVLKGLSHELGWAFDDING